MQFRLAVLVLAALLAVGCQKQENAATGDAPGATASAENVDAPIYRNDKGEIVCPVMHKVIASESAAQGSQVYEGKKYLFCCGMCPGKFKENPKLYAKS